jgi:Na+-transporting NADH:ubiquinone oxidoreductase subunit C
VTLGRTLLVTTAVAVGCALFVSTAVYWLRPLQVAHASVEQNRAILDAVGLLPDGEPLSDRQAATLLSRLEPLIVDLESGMPVPEVDARTYDQRAAAGDASTSVSIPTTEDVAALGRRARYARIYILPAHGGIERIVLPVHGQGMWSTIYGYLCLESDLNTIAGVSFYEHGETPGIGDRILAPEWRRDWIGKRLYDASGELRFRVIPGSSASAPAHSVDAITGATVTSEAVGSMIRYWFGSHGFEPLLKALRARENLFLDTP